MAFAGYGFERRFHRRGTWRPLTREAKSLERAFSQKPTAW